MTAAKKQASFKPCLASECSHIGNAGSRCQYPVYKVLTRGLEYSVIPAKSEAALIVETKSCKGLSRASLPVTNTNLVEWLIGQVGIFLSKKEGVA